MSTYMLNNMRRFVMGGFLALACNASFAEQLSGNELIKKYCSNVSASAGGSYAVEAECRTQETAAARALIKLNPEQRIWNYCQTLSDAAGGSYVVLLECADQEIRAKASLR
ncbi:hypothetical protein OYT13_13965 [Pandoraea sp. XJJ-1]|uniref:hypothetical protein n=1 Tax=Pandoraea sp. XJJ-1 TaxID=3002643 RepID=UPI0022829110|nr:hypothetical protein [Pandoraea sp. XJJ-1]WAL80980.1 hypothetical protein OYT13_13965 [Pandoraea sp. XJJ-1]